MLSVPRPFRTALCVVAALLAVGCGRGGDSSLSVIVVGEPGDPFNSGPRLSAAGQLVRAATTEGLVGFDERGRVIPALADRWIVTDDGLSYIFRLRDGVWPDGSEITGASARAALREAIGRLRRTPLGTELGQISEIRAMAGRVLELRLAAPNPDLLLLLAQPELGLVRKRRGAGPMKLERQGDVAVLTPIPPGERGLPAIEDWQERARKLRLTALPADAAVEAFRSGNADAVLGGRFESFPLAATVGITRGTTQVDPVAGLFGLSFVDASGPFATPELREALAMSIDRAALAAAFGADGWVPSSRMVSPGMEGDLDLVGERWAELALEARRALAAERVARWRGGEARPLIVRIALPEGPGADLLFARLSEDLTAIGAAPARVAADEDADLRLVDAVARYPRAGWFIGHFACSARRGLCNSTADTLAAQARAAPDTATRSALLAEAEAELTAANVFIPFGPPLRWSLLRRTVTGFAPNPAGVHPLMALAMEPG